MRRGAAVRLACAAALVVLAAGATARADSAAAPPPEAKRRWDWAVLPVASYAPETSLAVGAGGVIFDDSAKAAGPRRDDEVDLVLIWTLRKQFVATTEGTKYWRDGALFLAGDGAAMRFPNRFWGVGNDTPDAAEDRYTRSMSGLHLSFGVRVVEALYVGLGAGGDTYAVGDYAPDGSVAAYVATHARTGWLLGGGPFLRRDSRDDAIFPHRGSLTNLSATLSSNNGDRYDLYQVDQRTFVPVGARAVLAMQAYGRLARGDVPLDELSALGGAQRLRGYFEGRYRDQLYLVAQLEARVHIAWRLSVAPFAAAGNVFPDVAAVTLAHPKAAAGLSARINLKSERELNLRFDVAKSPTSSGVYVSLGEAF